MKLVKFVSVQLMLSIGGGTFLAGAVTITDDVTGIGEVTDSTLLPTDLQIPVQFIPANNRLFQQQLLELLSI